MTFLSIGLMATCVSEKYISQVEAVSKTWGNIDESANVKLFYFGGNIPCPLPLRNYINLPNIQEDYKSAFYKQFYGIKYLIDCSPSQFYMIAGTDNYVMIDKLISRLQLFSSDNELYYGGHGDSRFIAEKNIYFHSGGSGFVLSHKTAKRVYDLTEMMISEWSKICPEYLIPACDVAIAYYLNKMGVEPTVDKQFYGCNYQGLGQHGERCCHISNTTDIISCHYMHPSDMYKYHSIAHSPVTAIVELDSRFASARDTWSDIYEHLTTFRQYGSQCCHITEMGVRSVVSSWGFLKGLTENSSKEKTLVGVDLIYHLNIDTLKRVCSEVNVCYKFIQGDSSIVSIDETDLLFIDTWHVYGHLKRELEQHHSKVRKYILMHDTTIDGINGESIRNGWDIKQQSMKSGYSEAEIRKGLWPAIEEFIAIHPEWQLIHRYTNNNGLTILKRDV